ncbi:hypothetical protein E1A91_D01G217400v1 [Gossypium mustelinum]|uniref:Uncharacterized protein n=3 Tax=Gossypium TaxID=3633 RepID=A0A5J5SWW1_GOSBA|nr:hypothetical protein ES319_D01G211800v1 [Gossypium barbadense]TYG84157.1 hypothetical protein ES288_D01G226900v1 [Gossypium darwinii]TYI98485.1 hypothetical protein E1A91_D01G217400v1 [Gossypium mustelinum]
MNGHSYSKIKGTDVVDQSSRSMESSDLIVPFPQTSKSTSNPIPEESIKNSNPNTQCPSVQDGDDDDDEAQGTNGEMPVPTLRRNSSVSAAYALQLQAAVKRAFPMRRSSSVSESYCRIHDQYVTLAPPLDDDDESDITGTRRSVRKKNNNYKNRRDKILKAWKKIFGL